METRYLETLVTAVETGSFTRTAELMHITQSAVSQRMKFLEESLGQRLLERQGPLLRPTEAGQLVLEKARSIVALEREIRAQLRELGREKRLSICCTPTFGMVFLPQVLSDFMLRNADLDDFKFMIQQPEEALRGLQENFYQLAIIEHCELLDCDELEIIPLQRDELVFVSAPRLGLASGTIALEELLPFRIYARRDGCSSKELLKRNLAQAGKSLEDFGGTVISDDLRLTLREVVAGRGISFLSAELARDPVARGELVQHQVEGFQRDRSRSLLINHQSLQNSIARDFVASVCRLSGNGTFCAEPRTSGHDQQQLPVAG